MVKKLKCKQRQENAPIFTFFCFLILLLSPAINKSFLMKRQPKILKIYASRPSKRCKRTSLTGTPGGGGKTVNNHHRCMTRPVFVFTPLSCLITPILSMLEDSDETHQLPIFDQIPIVGETRLVRTHRWLDALTLWEIIEQKGTDSLMLREHALGQSQRHNLKAAGLKGCTTRLGKKNVLFFFPPSVSKYRETLSRTHQRQY